MSPPFSPITDVGPEMFCTGLLSPSESSGPEYDHPNNTLSHTLAPIPSLLWPRASDMLPGLTLPHNISEGELLSKGLLSGEFWPKQIQTFSLSKVPPKYRASLSSEPHRCCVQKPPEMAKASNSTVSIYNSV